MSDQINKVRPEWESILVGQILEHYQEEADRLIQEIPDFIFSEKGLNATHLSETFLKLQQLRVDVRDLGAIACQVEIKLKGLKRK